ncbi:hypothetical protein ACQP1G_22040 [Nocardia sp. CA-107356]|uniref:hypothetical protein n=1 Tax=Nocardia sp. CA-107356 TaxID=3239972 RepID=UPI003D9181F8
MTNQILATLGATVLILRAATLIPGALAELLRSCQQVLHAMRDLHTTLARPHRRGLPQRRRGRGGAAR